MPASTAFVGVNVVPMDHERVLPDQTVLVRNGRIVAIGDRATVLSGTADRIVRGGGRYLMPGLSDMHVHAWSPADALQFLAYGVTTVRNMWGSDLQLVWRDAISRGRMIGPSIFTTGPLMDGDPPTWTGSLVVRNPQDARRAVRRQKAQGYDALKVYNNLSVEAYESIAAEARDLGLPVVGHVPDAVGLPGVLRHGQRSIEHLNGYLEALERDNSPYRRKHDWPSRRKAIESHLDLGRIDAVAAETARAGAWNCVTLVVLRKWQRPDVASRFLLAPEMRLVEPVLIASWNDYVHDFRIREKTGADWRAYRKADRIRLTLTRALRDAGAGLLLGSDTPNPFVIPGFAAHEELENLVLAGLRPYEALRAGTSSVGEFLGSPEIGTIRIGSRADLLLVDRNPLRDVRNARRILGVMARGRWFPHAELRSRLARLKRSYSWSLTDLLGTVPVLRGPTGKDSGRYAIRTGGIDLGAECLWSFGHPGKSYRLRARAVFNNAPVLERSELDLRLDATGGVRSAEYFVHRSEGDYQIRMGSHRGALRLWGKGPRGAIAGASPGIRQDCLLMTPTIAPFVALLRRGAARANRAWDSVPIVRFELEPNFAFVHGTLRIRRTKADRTHAGTTDLAPIKLEFEEHRDDGESKGRIEVEKQGGLPRVVEVIDQTAITLATLLD